MNREWTDVDRIADDHTEAALALDPMLATFVGAPGVHDTFPDLSPAGLDAASQLRRRTLAALDAATPVDVVDRVTIAAMRSELRAAEAVHEIGDDVRALDVLASPQEELRMVFDLMPTGTADDWAAIARRMARLPEALDGYAASLRSATASGMTPARRQVTGAADQLDQYVGTDGFFFDLSARGAREQPAVGADLAHAARLASAAYAGLQDYLRRELEPAATDRDAVGRDRYAVHLRRHLGADVDLDETYAWGQDELARLVREQAATAERISSGESVAAVMTRLDADPGRRIEGTAALQRWMQQRSDEAIRALDGVHFDIPEPLHRLECLIAPTSNGGVYYTHPAGDFSRPGRMWWSVPATTTSFSTWQELTTIYHEGVPGHHLQIGQAVYRSDSLNGWRRQLAGTAGHAEGWALYAEQLMAELGFLDDPADRLGMLNAQAMRAARVVLDVGVHCELPMPVISAHPGAAWTFERAMEFFATFSAWDEGNRRFEVMRYFGWPGQAPTYKLGQRLWQQLRADATAAAGSRGAAFDLRAFHRDALALGGLPLDVLRPAVLGTL